VIRAVVSDFGGVLTSPLSDSFFIYGERIGLTPERFWEAIVKATEAAGGAHPLFLLERGEITEAEFLRRLEAHLDGVSLEGFARAFFDHLEPNEPVIGYLRELRDRGLRMALLTNNVREWEPLWRPKLPDIDEIFEVVVDSAFVGMRKPEPDIYLLTVDRLGGGLRPHDCVFLDDVEVNCEAARALGMRAVRYEAPDQAIADLGAVLREEGTL
jgi:epoxide hydrolase-like predicted phosphatase